MEATGKESLWDAGDVAAYLKVSKDTVYRWAKAGRIPSLMLEGNRRFDPAEIKEWVEEREAA